MVCISNLSGIAVAQARGQERPMRFTEVWRHTPLRHIEEI